MTHINSYGLELESLPGTYFNSDIELGEQVCGVFDYLAALLSIDQPQRGPTNKMIGVCHSWSPQGALSW